MPLGNAIFSRVKCFSYTPSGGVSVASRHFFSIPYVVIKKIKSITNQIIKSFCKNNHIVIKNYGSFAVTHIKAWTSFFSFNIQSLLLPQKTSFVVAKSFCFCMR